MNSKVWGLQSWVNMVPFNRTRLMEIGSISGELSLGCLLGIYMEIPKIRCINLEVTQEFQHWDKKKIQSVLIKYRWWRTTLSKAWGWTQPRKEHRMKRRQKTELWGNTTIKWWTEEEDPIKEMKNHRQKNQERG